MVTVSNVQIGASRFNLSKAEYTNVLEGGKIEGGERMWRVNLSCIYERYICAFICSGHWPRFAKEAGGGDRERSARGWLPPGCKYKFENFHPSPFGVRASDTSSFIRVSCRAKPNLREYTVAA